MVILYQLKQIKTKQKCYEATKQISRLYGGINPLDGQDLFEKLIFNYIPISLIYSIIFSICTATYTQLSDQDYTSAETEIKAMIVIIPAILALLPLLATWPDNKFIMHTFDEARFFDFDYKQRKSIEIELNETMEMLNLRFLLACHDWHISPQFSVDEFIEQYGEQLLNEIIIKQEKEKSQLEAEDKQRELDNLRAEIKNSRTRHL